ncbi:MAG TPA: glycosyltransferase family 4 protein [Flexivirga sp.]|uniref:glycosyltransferase family 4 protein n=1 Tax=Flexivirga sp. TaxID=1962927 RepID=UPI002B70DE04|nr:glycosyltransferase family 4 protein [Flexivirga sp.]HWC23430.1 glycosyltransferase family 4 protein [Flexivirga sp.]
MKVALWMPRASEIPGGHVIQMQRTAAALRLLGVEVVETTDPELPDEELDLVHGFGMGVHARHVESGRRRGLPVVISPVYVGIRYDSRGPEERIGARQALGRLSRAVRIGAAGLRGREPLIRRALAETDRELDRIRAWSAADMLLVNAGGERDELIADLGVQTDTRVVPNAVDPGSFAPVPGVERVRRSALFVGRIEPHKNQLGLIKALAGTDISLSIVGPPHPHHDEYVRACRAAASGRQVEFVGSVPHDQLAAHYSAAAVHVLPTWFETTGLVSLEAALCGCAVVSTSRGHAREYLQDDAWFCDPADPASVRRAVLDAVNAGPSPALATRIHQHYTWADTATETLAAYKDVLARRSAR